MSVDKIRIEEEKEAADNYNYNTDSNNDEYFGKLEDDDRNYDDYLKHNPNALDQFGIPPDLQNMDVRRSKRNIARPSFVEINENGITVGDNQDDDEYRLIK
jgi:hypothetical protein